MAGFTSNGHSPLLSFLFLLLLDIKEYPVNDLKRDWVSRKLVKMWDLEKRVSWKVF